MFYLSYLDTIKVYTYIYFFEIYYNLLKTVVLLIPYFIGSLLRTEIS